jgi:hypothetical protein
MADNYEVARASLSLQNKQQQATETMTESLPDLGLGREAQKTQEGKGLDPPALYPLAFSNPYRRSFRLRQDPNYLVMNLREWSILTLKKKVQFSDLPIFKFFVKN